VLKLILKPTVNYTTYVTTQNTTPKRQGRLENKNSWHFTKTRFWPQYKRNIGNIMARGFTDGLSRNGLNRNQVILPSICTGNGNKAHYRDCSTKLDTVAGHCHEYAICRYCGDSVQSPCWRCARDEKIAGKEVIRVLSKGKGQGDNE